MKPRAKKLAASAVGAAAAIMLTLSVTPAAQADERTCDPGEVCLWTQDQSAIYTTQGYLDNYVNHYWVNLVEPYRHLRLNDKVRKAYNNGCITVCGPTIVYFYRDANGGGGVVGRAVPGQEAWMQDGGSWGASSHYWQWS